MTSFTPAMATEFVHQSVPAIGRLGVVVDEIEPGSVRLRVPIEGNSNHLGTMYAGALFALAELPGGLLPLAALEPGKYAPILTGMEVTYAAPVRTDVTLSAGIDLTDLAELARRVDADGQAEYTLDLHGEDATGRTVITSRAHYQLRLARR